MTRRFLLEGIGIFVVLVLWLLYALDSSRVVQSTKTIPNVDNMAATLTAVELLSLDSVALQERLAAGLLSSVDLVKQGLQQIETHDRRGLKLNAMISIVPCQTLMTRSKQLDQERAEGRIRGPLYGIPMLVKVGQVNQSQLTYTLVLSDSGRHRYPAQSLYPYDIGKLRVREIFSVKQFQGH